GDVERAKVGLDGFEEKAQAERFKKGARLLQIWPVAERKSERLEPAGTHAELLHDVVGQEKHRPAVDTAGKTNAHRFPFWNLAEPFNNLPGQCGNISRSDLVEISRERVALGMEEACV